MFKEFSVIDFKERKALFRKAFVASVPVLLGYVTMGFAAGVLMAVKGGVGALAPFWSGLCGFAFISGTLSFAIVPAFAGGYTFGAVALLALGINFRYAFYGFSLVGKWKNIPLFEKWFLVHSLADEIYALDVAFANEIKSEDPLGELKHRYYCLWNHALNAAYWFFGTTAGGVAGAALPIPSKGIEFAMVALFLVIFTEQARGMVKRFYQ